MKVKLEIENESRCYFSDGMGHGMAVYSPSGLLIQNIKKMVDDGESYESIRKYVNGVINRANERVN